MDLNQYQQEAFKTAIYPNQGKNLVYATLGLLEESGEVAEKVGTGRQINNEEVIKELGDVLWYLACCCTEMQVDLKLIYQKSLNKDAPKSVKSLIATLFQATSKVAGKVKKTIRDDKGILQEAKKLEIIEHLASSMICLSILSETINSSLEEVASKNLEKLLDRKDRGKLKGSGDNR